MKRTLALGSALLILIAIFFVALEANAGQEAKAGLACDQVAQGGAEIVTTCAEAIAASQFIPVVGEVVDTLCLLGVGVAGTALVFCWANLDFVEHRHDLVISEERCNPPQTWPPYGACKVSAEAFTSHWQYGVSSAQTSFIWYYNAPDLLTWGWSFPETFIYPGNLLPSFQTYRTDELRTLWFNIPICGAWIETIVSAAWSDGWFTSAWSPPKAAANVRCAGTDPAINVQASSPFGKVKLRANFILENPLTAEVAPNTNPGGNPSDVRGNANVHEDPIYGCENSDAIIGESDAHLAGSSDGNVNANPDVGGVNPSAAQQCAQP